MAQRLIQSIIVLFAGFYLTACAGNTQWSKPGTGVTQMLRDQARCRNLASIEAEKELQLDQQTLRHSPSDSHDNYRAQMMTFEAIKYRTRLTEQCMHQRGYQKIKS